MAPEQVTSDLLDHKADVYSFCILLFHMLTGSLPFDGTMPLALQQLQMAEELPDISTIRYGFPPGLTTIMRRGTQLDLHNRPHSISSIMEQVEVLLSTANLEGISTAPVERMIGGITGSATVDLGGSGTIPLDSNELIARREAVEIYNRTRRAWANGQGRFILGITDFTLINDYYSQADRQGLDLDEGGRQMMLRGALEYDYEVDFWWGKLSEDNRRWAALHTVRGQNAAARVRALERLIDISDTDPPQIPRIVAQAMQVENNPAARLAGILVMEKRAVLMPEPRLKLNEARSRSQTASILLTRTLKLWTPGEWRESVYGPEIDTLLATMALDRTDPPSAEAAARAIARIRSQAALQRVALAKTSGAKGARRALALIRDEAPDLPGVDARTRMYAWLENTWRRLSDNPLQLTRRFTWAIMGAALGSAAYASVVLNTGSTGFQILAPQNLQLIVSLIVFMGVLWGLLVAVAGELPARLFGFWPWWGRLLVSAAIGIPLGTFFWWLYTYVFLTYTPEWPPLLPAGIGMAFGLIMGSVYRLPGWLLTLIMAVAIYLPIYAAHVGNATLGTASVLYVRPSEMIGSSVDQIFTAGIPFAVLFALGACAQKLIQSARQRIRKPPTP
jgi:hypothetical protein